MIILHNQEVIKQISTTRTQFVQSNYLQLRTRIIG